MSHGFNMGGNMRYSVGASVSFYLDSFVQLISLGIEHTLSNTNPISIVNRVVIVLIVIHSRDQRNTVRGLTKIAL
jgi:hypothetical protein